MYKRFIEGGNGRRWEGPSDCNADVILVEAEREGRRAG